MKRFIKKQAVLIALVVLAVSVPLLAGWVSGPWQTPQLRALTLVESDIDTSVATGDVGLRAVVPGQFAGCRLIGATAGVSVKGVTGTTSVNVLRQRGAATAEMLSTDITIGDEYYASDGVVSGTYDELAEGDGLGLTVTTVHSGTAPKGLSCTLLLNCPR